MSVVSGKRSIPKLDALIKAQRLVKHVLWITKNEKYFDLSYKALIEDINHCAERIYINAYTANNIYAQGQNNMEQRVKLETMSILECKSMLALIDLAWGIFHLKSNKVECVVKMTEETEKALQSWRRRDKEKLKEYT